MLYCDTRLGGVKRYYAYRLDDWDMRIPSSILKCVCFIGIRISGGNDKGKFLSLGTGFFIGVKQDDWDFLYLVTAKHVLDEAERGGYKHTQARVNKNDGGVDYVQLPTNDEWIRWQNGAVDLALIPMNLDYNVFEYEALPLDNLVTNEIAGKNQIGLGDDLFTVGLFSQRTGKQRNIPIIRTGVIAAHGHEPLHNKKGEEYYAYLVEMRSIGGLSGSPVFVLISRHRTIQADLPEGADWAYYCIGLVRGHWDLKREAGDDVLLPDVALGISPGENLNTGIAVVTPSIYIVAILMSPQLQEIRKRFIQMKETENQPTEDATKVVNEEQPFTKESFTDALRKVSAKVSEPESKKTETSE